MMSQVTPEPLDYKPPLSSFLEDYVQTLFNDPTHSDIILVFNHVKYYLISHLVKRSAPLLYQKFEDLIKTNSSKPPIQSTPEEVLENLSKILAKADKPTVSMGSSTISKEALDAVLESFYGKSFKITSVSNLEGVYQLSVMFGMIDVRDRCIETFQKTIKLETILDDVVKAIKNDTPFRHVLTNYLWDNLELIPLNKTFFDFVSTLDDDDFIDAVLTAEDLISDGLVTSFSDSLIHDMMNAWAQHHANPDHIKDVFSQAEWGSHTKQLFKQIWPKVFAASTDE